MGMSAGAGSPIWFMCPAFRQLNWRTRDSLNRVYHTIFLTGREKPYKAKRGTALGVRSTHTSREYICYCGYVGWSNHVDLEKVSRALLAI